MDARNAMGLEVDGDSLLVAPGVCFQMHCRRPLIVTLGFRSDELCEVKWLPEVNPPETASQAHVSGIGFFGNTSPGFALLSQQGTFSS